MALKESKLNSSEIDNMLAPCWITGLPKLSTSKLSTLIEDHEIKAVNVVECCNRIHEIIDDNKAIRKQNHDERNMERFVSFQDIVRLTHGISFIHKQQVSALLVDTARLLHQMMNTNIEIKTPIKINVNRKRKRVISKQTTTTTTTTTMVSVSKRSRVMSPQLLDEDHLDYFRNMLNDSMLSSKEQIKEVNTEQTTCTTERLICLTETETVTEFDSNQMWNDGFGEPNQGAVATLEEFLCAGNSLKRKCNEPSSPTDLGYKVRKLSPNNTNDSSKNLNHFVPSPVLDSTQEIESIAVHLAPSPPPAAPSSHTVLVVHSKTSKNRKRRKTGLIIDKRIKLAREELYKNQTLYLDGLQKPWDVYAKPSKDNRTLMVLNSFKQSTKNKTQEQMEDDCEDTLRAIFSVDYNEVMAKSILGNNETSVQQVNNSDEVAEPIIPTVQSPEPDLPELSPVDIKIKNDSLKQLQTNGKQRIDVHSVLMDLLFIWRGSLIIKPIDANQFVKSFPNRVSAALAFNHLLALQRDDFIYLSKKLKTIDIDEITAGLKSLKLLQEFKYV